jgi:hypothetical protein
MCVGAGFEARPRSTFLLFVSACEELVKDVVVTLALRLPHEPRLETKDTVSTSLKVGDGAFKEERVPARANLTRHVTKK